MFIKPKNDYVFKRIFSKEEILIPFLEAVLNIRITNVEIGNTEITKENIVDKKSILDVKATINDGVIVDIEIQVGWTAVMAQRSLYYWSKMYSEQLKEGQKYENLRKTICINIVNFDIIDTNKYHTIFSIRENEENIKLTDLLEIHFLELRKVHSLNTKLEKWLSFIKIDSEEELKNMIRKDFDVDKAIAEMNGMMYTKEEREAALSREMYLHDEASRLYQAEMKGVERVAIKLLEKGLDIKDIVEVTGLSRDEIEKLI